MTELEKYIASLPKPLSKKEQNILFKEFYTTKNEAIREKLINHNLRLAVNVVLTRFLNPRIDQEDALQIASYALVKAVDNFNPTKELEFSTYAVPCILQELVKELDKDGKRIHPDSIYDEVQNNTPSSSDDTSKQLIEFIPDETESHIAYDYEYKVFKAKVNKYINENLSEREKYVYNALIGVGYSRPQTLKEISKTMGVTHQMVGLIKKRIVDKLRSEFQKDYPEFTPFN